METEKENDKWVRAYRLVMVGMVGLTLSVGGWFSNQIWNGQKEIQQRLNLIDVNTATATASRFTSAEWIIGKAAIDAQLSLNERRIFKLESSIDQIGKDILEIKQNTKRPQP